MTPCMWCRKPIEDGAHLCPYCRTWQRAGADTEATAKAQIVDDNIIYWGKFVLGILAVMTIVIVGVVGYDIRDASRQASQASMDAGKSLSSVDVAALKADQVVEKLNWLAERQERELEDTKQAKAELEATVVNTGSALEALDIRVARLESVSVTWTARASPSASALSARLAVVQVATPVQGTGGGETRRSYNVRLAICLLAGDICGPESIDGVSRVVYRFDQNWFSVPDVAVVNAADAFAYSVRVWGSTTLTACIFVAGVDEPVVRIGRISTAQSVTLLGPQASGDGKGCEGIGAKSASR